MKMSIEKQKYQKEWRNKNRARVRATNRRWRKDNWEKCKSDARLRYRSNPIPTMLHNARKRAKQAVIPFNITEQDVAIPAVCPVLGIPLFMSKGKLSDNSPSIDKIRPELGYVRGNIEVISMRANRLKCDASVSELESVLTYMRVKGL